MLALSVIVLISVVTGMARVVRGPTPADRMLSALLFGTSGVATLLLLARAMKMPALRDVALVFAVLAAVTAVAFVRLVGIAGDSPAREDAQ
jgi:multicomponent Na+:H+ antiporter subunit F